MQKPTQPVTESAEAVIETRRGFSLIWVVPLVAVIIGGWLVYKALTEKGPTITISFESAEGVVAGKTKVKYKDVEAGTVQSVELSEDLGHVIVTATLVRELAPYLTDRARFWVVRARVAGGEVSGLSTLFSGVYIGMDPGKGGKPARHFKGLAISPVVTFDTPGRQFELHAESLGSLGTGSPVYFRQIKAGVVASYALDPDGRAVTIKIFVDAPYDQLVRENTRFWNASGISASVTADGFRLRTESLSAVLIGGVAFDTPQTLESSEPVEANHVFKLYESLQEATAPVYERKERYVLYFDDSVRGLKVGAPVEFRGIRIGEVIDFRLEGDSRDLTFRIPVLVELEPDRIHVIGPRPASLGAATQLKTMEALVNKGLRAQLKTGSLLTGDLYVDFDFYPEAQQAKVQERNGRVVLPTVPTSMEELRANAMQLLAKLQRFPLDEIGADLRKAIQGFTGVTDSPELKQAIANLDQTLAESRKLAGQLNTDLGPLSSDLARALDELSAAARSIRVMADYLERHPDALIKGKRRNR